jgi:hypothetical protein
MADFLREFWTRRGRYGNERRRKCHSNVTCAISEEQEEAIVIVAFLFLRREKRGIQ